MFAGVLCLLVSSICWGRVFVGVVCLLGVLCLLGSCVCWSLVFAGV